MHESVVQLIVVSTTVIIGLKIIGLVGEIKKRRRFRKQMEQLLKTSLQVSVSDFLKMRSYKEKGSRTFETSLNVITGVYVLINNTKNKVYVGQSKNVFTRVNNHFIGSGNGDVYADYRLQDNFEVRLVPLTNSQFYSLDALEKSLIEFFNAAERGYNKNKGNGRTYRPHET